MENVELNSLYLLIYGLGCLSSVHPLPNHAPSFNMQMSLIYALWKSRKVLRLVFNNVNKSISWWPEDKCQQEAYKRELSKLQTYCFYCSPWERNEMCPSKNYYKQNQRTWWKNTSMYLQRVVVDHLLQQNNIFHEHRDSTGCCFSGTQPSVWCTLPQSSLSNYRSDVWPLRWGKEMKAFSASLLMTLKWLVG